MFARFDENPAMTLRVIKETKRYGRTDARAFAGGINNLQGQKYNFKIVGCDPSNHNGPSKIVSMIRKYHNHKLQTNLWHHEEEPHNNHETPGRQSKAKQPALSSPSR